MRIANCLARGAVGLALVLAPIVGGAEQPPAAQPVAQGCSGAGYRRLDFRIGEFEVTGAGGARAGESRVESVLNGCLLLEYWKGAISGYGQAMFYYDRRDQLWRMTYVTDDGDVLRMQGAFTGDALVLSGTNEFMEFRGLHRMTWSPLPEGGARQFWEFSTDDGATWKTIHTGYFARRR